MPGERRDGPDRVLLVRDRDVDVQPVDGLHPRGPAHLLVHPAVAFLVGNPLRGRLGEGVRPGCREPRPATLDEIPHASAQGGQLRRQLGRRPVGRGAHLHAGRRELGGHGVFSEPGRVSSGEHGLYYRDKRE